MTRTMITTVTLILKKVIEFCEHHLSEPMMEINKPLESEDMADVVQKVVLPILLNWNYFC